jgi:predicted glycoside hydrolase/deacetylase ChbG (UPF0249 family)
MLLIVNADDLGANERINEEIFALMKSGRVTSATIIANAPGFEHAAERIRDFPGCSFGVHLNLTVFAPLSHSGGLDAIVDERGHLSKKLFNIPITASLQDACRRELTAQVQRAFDAGIPVSHFDSHNHIHTIPRLFPVLKSLQRKFRIPKVRSTINLLPPGQQMSGVRSLKKRLFRFVLRHVYSTKSPEGLGDFCDFYPALTSGNLPQFRCLELMVHPGTSNPRYNEEVELLRSDWLQSLPPSVQLGSYHSI